MKFVNHATSGNLQVGDDLGSRTSFVQTCSFCLDGRQVVLVDTPGFNDTDLSDIDILQRIADYLQQR